MSIYTFYLCSGDRGSMSVEAFDLAAANMLLNARSSC